MANFEFEFTVIGTVPEIRQKGYTCWAAAAAMMHGWKKQRSMTTAEAIAVAGSPYTDLLKRGRGLPYDETRNFGFAMGMKTKVARSFTDVQMLTLMRSRNTPLMVSSLASGAGMSHFYVIKAMKTLDGGSGLVDLTVNNSNAEPIEERLSFDDLIDGMERQVANDAETEIQMLHY